MLELDGLWVFIIYCKGMSKPMSLQACNVGVNVWCMCICACGQVCPFAFHCRCIGSHAYWMPTAETPELQYTCTKHRHPCVVGIPE